MAIGLRKGFHKECTSIGFPGHRQEIDGPLGFLDGLGALPQAGQHAPECGMEPWIFGIGLKQELNLHAGRIIGRLARRSSP